MLRPLACTAQQDSDHTMAFTTQEKSSHSVHGQAIPFRPSYPTHDGYTVLTTLERILVSLSADGTTALIDALSP